MENIMKTPIGKITNKQLLKLAKEMLALPPESADNHISLDDLIAYVMEELSSQAVKSIDGHLEFCPECLAQAERMTQVTEFLGTEKGEAWLSSMEAIIPPPSPPMPWSLIVIKRLQQLKESWQLAFAHPAFAAATGGDKRRAVFNWQSKGGALSYSVTEEMNGDWYVLFESKETDAEGKRFRFRLGSFEKNVILEKVTDGEFAAEFVIPRSSRPEGAKDFSNFELEPIE
jgi:hypothetical protein